ncbi:MAG: tRNA (guanosine(37)-N1)-methyltransferase TrmD [Candidatus Taylorbacteria bacterium]
MTFHVITLFPKTFDSYLGESILKRAIEDKKIKIEFYNPRDFVIKPKGRKLTYSEKRVDGRPYGGGPGMVIEALPVIRAVESAKVKVKNKSLKILWLSPSGKQFTTEYAKKTAQKYEHVIIICGRYEGIDARVKKICKVEEVSVGPFVLTGGELPAMLIIDVMARQIEGVLGNFSSLEESRVSSSLAYTRPEVLVYKKKKYRVPKILLSGHRAKIEEWRLNQKS